MERSQLSTPLSLEMNQMVAHRILGRVKRLRFGMRWVLKLEMFLALMLLLLLGVISGLLFILHFGPTPLSLGIFSGTSFALILYGFWRFIFRNRRKRLSTLAMSAWVEKAIPGLSDRLITAVEFTQCVTLQSGEAVVALYDSDFISAFFEDTERLLRRVFLMRVFFRRRLIALLIAILAILAFYQNIHYFTIYTSSDLNKIYLNSHRAIFRGMGAPLVVEPGSTKIVRGGDLKVSAYSLRVGGKPKMEIFFRAPEQPWESASMVGEAGGSYSFHFQQLTQPLTYFVSDGKAKSDEYEIQLVEGPQLANIRVKLVMPSYTGLGIMIGDDGEGDIKAVGGTRAEVVVSFREEIENATLLIGQGEEGNESETTNRLKMVENSGNWRTEFRIDSSGWYRIIAVDAEGFSSGKELTYTIEVKEEERPTIEIVSPRGNIDFLATDAFPELKEGKIPQVPLLYKCDDDFGIARVELHFMQTEQVTGTRILEDFDYGQQHVEREYRWNIEPFWGGEMVIYFLRVYDHFALREIREMGQTEHYQDSRKLRFFWGQTQYLPDNEITDSQEQKEDRQEEANQRDVADNKQETQEDDTSEEIANELSRLSEQIQQVMQKQKEINRKAGQKADQGDRTPDEKLSQQQKEVSKEISRIRRSLQQQAEKAESEQKDKKDKDESEKKDQEEELEEKKAVATSISSASPDDNRPGDKEDDKVTAGTGSKDSSAQTNVSGSKSQNTGSQSTGSGQQMRQLAEQLERQRIEKTQNGFKTKTGLEGISQENRKRLEQGRFRDAQEKGQQLAHQLEQAQGMIKQIQSEYGLNSDRENESEPDQTTKSSSNQNPAQQNGKGVNAAQKMTDSGLFDEYQPSQFDPPQLRELKRRAGQLSEFRDSQHKDGIMGRAAAEERYPLKYEGLVETYFQVLTDSGE